MAIIDFCSTGKHDERTKVSFGGGFSVGLASLAIGLLLLSCAVGAKETDLAIIGVTVIDVGERGHSASDRSNATILIRNGVISQLGDRDQVALPRGVRVIDATGKFVVPGLIDGFGSLRNPQFAAAYLYEGVTTVYVAESPRGLDGEQTIVESTPGPRLLRGASISGYLPAGAVPNSHPWIEHRLHDTRKSAAELINEVDGLADRGVRGILIGLDVWPDQLDTIIAQSRHRHLATSVEPAFTSYPYAIHAGVGALVRNDRYDTALATAQDLLAYADDPMGRGGVAAFRAVCSIDPNSSILDALGTQLAKSRTAVMPILSIEATADDVGAPNPWLSRSSVFVEAKDLDDPVDARTGARPYLQSHPDRREALRACALKRQTVDRRLHALGAIHLAGSGAPAFGIMPGGGLHQELRLLQSIGLTPREALAAATGNFAEVFGWDDVGKIQVGRVGDLIILDNDPRMDISAIDDIRVVVHDGRVVDRSALLANATRRQKRAR